MPPILLRLAVLSGILSLTACNLPIEAFNPAAGSRPSATNPLPAAGTPFPPEMSSPQPLALPSSPSETPSLTLSPTSSETPSLTFSPSPSQTPSLTLSPTFAFPQVTVNQQAHCRYGPAKAYLHAADLYPGDVGSVRGRFQFSGWLHVKFDKLNYFCWVAPSVVTVSGDLTTVRFTEPSLPGPSVLYSPPDWVTAVREGSKVTISWAQVNMTDDDDRGYFLELWVCQDGAYLWWTAALDADTKTSYTVKDEPGCPAPSSGTLYAVEKHGYTRPKPIAWPAP